MCKSRKRILLQATEEGGILGTVAYMSPEQAEGKPVDGRSDIFSFGALLYESVTRCKAFQADSSLAILTAILRENPKPASSVARGIPPELDRIVERCLRKDPERRFQSAADLKVMLEDLRGEIRQAKPTVEASSPARGRGFWLAGLAVILALAGLGAWVLRSPRPPAQKALRIVPVTSYPGHERNPSLLQAFSLLPRVIPSRFTVIPMTSVHKPTIKNSPKDALGPCVTTWSKRVSGERSLQRRVLGKPNR